MITTFAIRLQLTRRKTRQRRTVFRIRGDKLFVARDSLFAATGTLQKVRMRLGDNAILGIELYCLTTGK